MPLGILRLRRDAVPRGRACARGRNGDFHRRDDFLHWFRPDISPLSGVPDEVLSMAWNPRCLCVKLLSLSLYVQVKFRM